MNVPFNQNLQTVLKMSLRENQVLLADGEKLACKIKDCTEKVRLTKNETLRHHVAKHILSMSNGPNAITCDFCGITGDYKIRKKK